MNTNEKVAESNRIEGIKRRPTAAEIDEHERFVSLEKITVEEIERFVYVYQPGARLRDQPGLDVIVGGHRPPRGGVLIPHMLDEILSDANVGRANPWRIHIRYENLHPFTDGNGRSGRALWYWMMSRKLEGNLGFLHAFYYQTLQNSN